MQEKENILRILKETKEAIKQGDIVKIKNLSNQTNNTASRTQDPDNITVAVIVYSIGKILERDKYREYPEWNRFYKNIVFFINEIINSLEENRDEKLKKNLGYIRKEINNLSGKLKKYIQDVFRKASINKASKIYEHGISMEKTAKLLGISMFELASYAGQTEISDVPLGKTLDTKKRIKLVIDIFS